MENETEEPMRKSTPPPPYSPERPPPPYSKMIDIDRNAPHLPCTPFSSGSVTSIVHPRLVSTPTSLVISSSEGINPVSGSSNTSFAVINYPVKRATTAEPHDEFCPKCQCRIRTKQSHKSGRLTWLLVFIILILFFPLAFVPFLIDSCKDVRHYCPKCNMLLSVKKRFFF
ncbi:Lipopolysaccharide-induced tumor necrosis factor-alpha factor-like protein [Dirofilaria immitis]|nr:Lipopolysaccharide-induced tumor necrosis factor-alpha factor-like protein [Dirofilaria immitis]